ncbi:hypothetical protein ACFLQ6_04945 [Thermoproteota archaeon]
MNSGPTEMALRAYILHKEHEKKFSSSFRKENYPNIVAVIDTETTNDPYQNLLFGSFGIWVSDKLHRFIIFYSDNSSKTKVNILKNHVKKLQINNVKVELIPVSYFKDMIFYPWIYHAKARLVGFNLPFDISHLAIHYGLGRRKWKGGFTFTLSKKRFLLPIRIKSLDSTKAFIEFVKPSRRNQKYPIKHFKGRFLDLRTLGFALTNSKLTLDSACKLFQTEYRKTKTEEHGKITPEYINYNISDVLATYNLHNKMIQRYNSFHLDLKPEKTYSPASIGKQYLKQMQIKTFRKQNLDFPPEILGYIMTTYYGGRSEVRIRKKPKKVRYMDFTSMYPSLFSLFLLWQYLTAKRIEPAEATKEIRKFVEDVDLESLRNPELWKNMVAIVQIQSENDILPVRTHYGEKYVYNIGINYLTSSQPLWYALPDVIASKLLTGKTPKILKAIRFVPKGKQPGLKSIKITGDNTVSPDEDLLREIIDLRQNIKKEMKKYSKNSAEHSEHDAIQHDLKIIANATSYGIFIEVNTEDAESNADVYGLDHFKCIVSKKESFGTFFNPIISIMLTSGARLLLAMAESWLEKHNGYYAFCDTDSMSVSPFHWKKLQQYFEPLNPFSDCKFLKLEEENFENGQLGEFRDLWFYGISAKRYVLFYLDNEGKPVPLKWSSHGLGHLLHENELEWEKQLWTNILSFANEKILKKEFLAEYENECAISKLALTKPHLFSRVKNINKGKPFHKKIRPYNFVLAGSSTDTGSNGEPIVPLTSFTRPYDLAPHQPFTNTNSGKLYTENTELYWKRLDIAIEEYVEHHENKFENGHRCGTMKRRHITIDPSSITYIGKESNELEETEILGIVNLNFVKYQNVSIE